MANLSALGLSVGPIADSGDVGGCCNARSELFVDGQPAVLARWPNIGADGLWRWARIGDTNNRTWVAYTDARQDRWAAEQDAWLHGYWMYDWADNYVRIAGVCGFPRMH